LAAPVRGGPEIPQLFGIAIHIEDPWIRRSELFSSNYALAGIDDFTQSDRTINGRLSTIGNAKLVNAK
jgi:hypothetical protein